MCGIVLVIGEDSYTRANEAILRINHRGGDDFNNVQISSNTSLAFTRLAINDKSENARQPFEYSNLVGAFNGEIYNSDELKRKFNLTTKSFSDTEVILPLYKKIGSKIYLLLDGMFSGVIYDKDEIIVIKDPFSKKPLFLVKTENNVFFVSELKAVKEKVIYFENIKSGVSKYTKSGKLISEEYSDVKFHIDGITSVKSYYEIINNAVLKRIPSEKFGIFLSGGLDSSIIAYLTSRVTDSVIYYSLVDENSSDFESVKNMIDFLKIDKNKIKYISLPPKEEIEPLINKVVYHTESYNPSIISNGLGTYLLSKEAKKDGIKVVLSGEGADEVFCGYKSFYKDGNYRDNWRDLREEFFNNLYFTELRRVDLCSMAHSIESRSPFLDNELVKISNSFNDKMFFKNGNGKAFLRDAFRGIIPDEIVDREKVSFDRGSGLRGLVVSYLKRSSIFETEKDFLKSIWMKYYNNSYGNIIDHEYFHSYPSFNKVIAKRRIS